MEGLLSLPPFLLQPPSSLHGFFSETAGHVCAALLHMECQTLASEVSPSICEFPGTLSFSSKPCGHQQQSCAHV